MLRSRGGTPCDGLTFVRRWRENYSLLLPIRSRPSFAPLFILLRNRTWLLLPKPNATLPKWCDD